MNSHVRATTIEAHPERLLMGQTLAVDQEYTEQVRLLEKTVWVDHRLQQELNL
jgi:hypothetical protein